MKINISDQNCPVKKVLEIIGGKWTLLIIFQINTRTIRYGELKRCIPGISEKMLIEQLKFLCNKGFVAKKAYLEIPPKVEYKLTSLGKNFLPIIDQIATFGLEYL